MEQVQPMLLRSVETLPAGPDWVFEPKFDGYRAVAYNEQGKVRLLSRTGRDFTSDFRGVARELPEALLGHTAVLDGEMIGLDARGCEKFSELQRKTARAVFCAFDLVRLDGIELVTEPLRERRRLLEEVLTPTERVWLMPQYDDGDALLAAVAEQGLEGVVAKKRSSLYLPGRRSYAWRRKKLRPGGFAR